MTVNKVKNDTKSIMDDPYKIHLERWCILSNFDCVIDWNDTVSICNIYESGNFLCVRTRIWLSGKRKAASVNTKKANLHKYKNTIFLKFNFGTLDDYFHLKWQTHALQFCLPMTILDIASFRLEYLCPKFEVLTSLIFLNNSVSTFIFKY